MTEIITSNSRDAEALLERLADPAVSSALHSLLDNAELIAVLVEGLNGFISRSELIVEEIAGGMTDLREVAEASRPAQPIDLNALMSSLAALSSALPQLTPSLTRAAEEDLLGTLLDSGLASPPVLEQVQILAGALNHASAAPETEQIKVKGAFSMMRAMKDPDVGRGLGHMLNILKSLGHELDSQKK